MNALLKTSNRKGKYLDLNSKNDVISYILDPNKMIHNYYGGIMVDHYNIAESMKQVSEKFHKEKGVQLRHFILSFSPHEIEPATVNEIAQQIVVYLGNEYQTVYSVHENKAHVHIHIVMNSVSYIDGHRYYGTRMEFKSFMNFLKKLLRNYGIYDFRYESNCA